MPDEFDDDDDLDTGSGDSSQLVKDLRRQLKAKNKEIEDLTSFANEFRAQKRKETVTGALQARGGDPKYAKFFTGEDSSQEAINAWLDENAELFNLPDADSEEDEAAAAAQARISAAASSARRQTLGTPQDFDAALRNAKTPEELQAAIRQLEQVKVPNR